MVNAGRSSTGCATCRKRKIKCDEGRPGCRKCVQTQRQCPGYPFLIELQLLPDALDPPHNISTSGSLAQIEQPSNRSSISKSSPSRVAESVPPATHVARSIELSRPHTPREARLLSVKEENLTEQSLPELPLYRKKSISPPPKYDIQHQAICFFLHRFSYQASRLFGIPILDFLPDMLKTSENHQAIQHASKAVSRMTLADQYSGRDVRLETVDEYAKALLCVKDIMSSEAEAIKDEAITSVWLLGLYEAVHSVISHFRTPRKAQNVADEWNAHIQHMRGAMRLLRLRGSKQFENPRSEKIFRIFKAAIQMRLFILNSCTSADFDCLEVDIYKDEHEFVPSRTANKASLFFTKTARHLERTKYTLQKFDLQPNSMDLAAELDQLLYEGECSDAGMLMWSKQEAGWDLFPVQGDLHDTPWSTCPYLSRYFCVSFWIFLYWLRYLIARVKLYETLGEIVKAKKRVALNSRTDPGKLTHLDAKLDSFGRIIQLTADDLIGLTAYALGDISNTGQLLSAASCASPLGGVHEVNVVAAMQLVIPLKVLQRSNYTRNDQNEAIDMAIARIADGFRRQPIIADYLK